MGFRNLEHIALRFSSRFNFITGDNAQGKTSLLEAIAFCCDLKSFRGALPETMVAHDAEQASLKMNAETGGLTYDVTLTFAKGRKSLSVNEKTVGRHKDYLGKLPIVSFIPDDVRLATGAPENRRRFLDRTLFLVRPAHWDRLIEYRQVLKRRNMLLKQRKTADPVFTVYTENLAKLGAKISFGRHKIVDSLAKQVEAAVSEVSGGADEVRLDYRSHISKRKGEVVDDEGESLLALLQKRLHTDRERGWTSVGPHTEDLHVLLGDKPAAKVASQGQRRALALALKIAEIEVIRRIRGTTPALLIDDLSSEFDETRRKRLFDYLKRTGGQVFITSTDDKPIGDFTDEETATFNVKAGSISRCEKGG